MAKEFFAFIYIQLIENISMFSSVGINFPVAKWFDNSYQK